MQKPSRCFFSQHSQYRRAKILTVEVKAEVVVLAANRSSRRMLVPDLVVVSGLLPQDHLRTRTFPATLHIQYEPRSFADDHEIFAFDPHRWTVSRMHTKPTKTPTATVRASTGLHCAARHVRFLMPTHMTRLRWWEGEVAERLASPCWIQTAHIHVFSASVYHSIALYCHTSLSHSYHAGCLAVIWKLDDEFATPTLTLRMPAAKRVAQKLSATRALTACS